MEEKIRVSIVIINYNGRAFLKTCLDSIKSQNFPEEKYEIVLVDNNSRDTSLKFVREQYPEVEIIESKENLGFAGGANLGVRHTRGEYVVFLNTDTKVDINWLKFLMIRIESDKNIAAVNSKLLLYYPFIKLSLVSDTHPLENFSKSNNFLLAGVFVEKIFLDDPELDPLIKYSSGFYDKNLIVSQNNTDRNGDETGFWTNGNAEILVPCNISKTKINLSLIIRSETNGTKTGFVVKNHETTLISDYLKPHEIKKYRIFLDIAEINPYFHYVVQNAGLAIFKSGYGRDRGAVVKDHQQFYETDCSYYNQAREVHAFSGASVILRKNVFKKLNGFDSSFFMYYEDVDMSLKMRRMGWKIFYEPKSVVYHKHAATSKEWSRLFSYNVEKNHLAILIKHFPIMEFIKEYLRFLVLWVMSFLKMCEWRLIRNWSFYSDWKEKVEYRKDVVFWVSRNFFRLIKERLKLTRSCYKSMNYLFKDHY